MFNKSYWQAVYLKLFGINDTPHKIALGLGLGVFLGILPGTGPIAALVVASALKLNRASALLGTLLTNTWLSVVSFILSVKIGSVILGVRWQEVYNSWLIFIKDFRIENLFKFSLLKIVFPVLLGYLAVSVLAGVIAYLIALGLLKKDRK
jgi:uncharacterized protein (DUF2062 family)